MYTLRSALYPSLPCTYLGDQGRVSSKEHKSHCRILTYPWGLRSKESSLLCCKLGDPRSAEVLVAAVAVPLLTDGVDPKDPDPFAQAFGGLVNNDSDSARCLTWCITPSQNKVRVCVTQDRLPSLQEPQTLMLIHKEGIKSRQKQENHWGARVFNLTTKKQKEVNSNLNKHIYIEGKMVR